MHQGACPDLWQLPGATRSIPREIIGVRVLDHIIVGEAPAFASLKQRGGW